MHHLQKKRTTKEKQFHRIIQKKKLNNEQH